MPARAAPAASPLRSLLAKEGGRVFVLGAGVDMAYGVPIMTQLIRAVAEFARDEGKTIDRALRDRLPYLHFSFDQYAGDQGDAFVERLFSSAEDTVPTLRAAAGKLRTQPKYRGIAEVLDRLCGIAENNLLSEEALSNLAELAGEPVKAAGAGRLLRDNTGLSATPAQALRRQFQRVLVESDSLSKGERDVLEFFITATSNIEELISFYFMKSSIVTGTEADRKRFLYIIWMLWAFLRVRSAGLPTGQRSVYQHLPVLGGHVVTFNYTLFFDPQTLKHVKFFHGRLDEYLRFDTREVVTAAGDALLRVATSVPGIVQLIESLRLDVKQNPHLDVPAIVPPTSFKPVMSRAQLRLWVDTDALLQRASTIVIIGYSLGAADEHFNDMLRHCNPLARIIAVNPDSEGVAGRLAGVVDIDPSTLTTRTWGDYELIVGGRILCVPAKAEALTPGFMAELEALS